jgi:hypothetical protein
MSSSAQKNGKLTARYDEGALKYLHAAKYQRGEETFDRTEQHFLHFFLNRALQHPSMKINVCLINTPNKKLN